MLPVKIKEIMVDLAMNPVLLVVDEKEERALPIVVGHFEAYSIALALEGVDYTRPLTHDLIKTLCDKLGGKLKKVVITDMRDNTYYAELYIEEKDSEIAIDARPSDAIAFALRANAPIFLSEKVEKLMVKMDELFSEEKQKMIKELLKDYTQTDKKLLH